MALHDQDPERWNPTTLSTRFSAAKSNVEALITLHAMRKLRHAQLNEKDDNERNNINNLHEKVQQAWAKLPELHMRPIYVSKPSPQTPSLDTANLTEVPGSEEEPNEQLESPPMEQEEHVQIPNSTWQSYLEAQIENVPADITRRTTYAFVEIGSNPATENIKRAVWIREGSTGSMRFADDKERRLLLNQVRAKDTLAWKT